MRRFMAMICGILILGAGPALGQSLAPEEVVREYLGAVQNHDFGRAYDLVSEGMHDGKSKEVWEKELQYMFQLSETKIFDYQVFPGEIQGETAKVPNILSSQDKFLNQLGVEEYELYTLIKQNGEWRIDQQSIVIDAESKQKWFPDESPEEQTGGGDRAGS